MKLCDPDHSLAPSRDVGLFAMAVPAPDDRWPVAPPVRHRSARGGNRALKLCRDQPHGLPLPVPTLVRSILFFQMCDIDYQKRAGGCDNQDIAARALGSFR
jgi:hypothetical protein